MRIRVPDDLQEIADRVAPYLQFNSELQQELKEDAPTEIREAYKAYLAWFERQKLLAEESLKFRRLSEEEIEKLKKENRI